MRIGGSPFCDVKKNAFKWDTPNNKLKLLVGASSLLMPITTSRICLN